MLLRKSIIAMTAVAAFVGLAAGSAAAAPNIPCKTAKLIVPWKAGGGRQAVIRAAKSILVHRLNRKKHVDREISSPNQCVA